MPYYRLKQHDITDCGAVCLATISKQYGLKLSISKIREVAGTDKQGTNAYGMIKAAEELGFTAKGVKGDKEAFFSEFPLPAIAHVIIDGKLQHNELKVVLYIPENEISKIKIGQKTEYIFDALPYTEYGKITGEIVSVSEDSVTNESAQTKFYIANASISEYSLENNNGEKREVKTGMLVQAKTISGSKKAIVWLMEKLNFMD